MDVDFAPPTVIIVTGHPATGKTSIAKWLGGELHVPTLCRDDLKETMMDVLGWSTKEWSRQLSVASWRLFYQQIEELLRAGVSHIAESNFDPRYADPQWQRLVDRYRQRILQVRCESEPTVQIARYRQRIADGSRHPGHVDQGNDPEFYETIQRGPLGWVNIESERIVIDTTDWAGIDFPAIVTKLETFLSK